METIEQPDKSSSMGIAALAVGLLIAIVATWYAAHTVSKERKTIANEKTVQTEQLEANKKLVAEYYELWSNKKDGQAAGALLSDKFIQHNPGIPDGREGFVQGLAYYLKQAPNIHSEIKRIEATGDLVFVHALIKMNAQDRGSAVMDIFRVKDGKIQEHWDVMQQIPEQAQNKNGMF